MVHEYIVSYKKRKKPIFVLFMYMNNYRFQSPKDSQLFRWLVKLTFCELSKQLSTGE